MRERDGRERGRMGRWREDIERWREGRARIEREGKGYIERFLCECASL